MDVKLQGNGLLLYLVSHVARNATYCAIISSIYGVLSHLETNHTSSQHVLSIENLNACQEYQGAWF